MGNFFNNRPKFLKLIIRVRIYHIPHKIYTPCLMSIPKFAIRNKLTDLPVEAI